MVSKRDRILALIKYFESIGIEVNYGKNKARGNKGFFLAKNNIFRIDIAKNLSEEDELNVLLHEFAHYIHFSYDATLKKLDFIFEDFDDEILEELISLTVDLIPKKSIEPLYVIKQELKTDIDGLLGKLKIQNPFFNQSKPDRAIEKKIKNKGLSALLRYDKVKIYNFFSYTILSIDSLDKNLYEQDESLILYLKLKSKQRALKRINARISRLNRYYNSNAELFARAFELYFTNSERVMELAPNVYNSFEKLLESGSNIYIEKCYKILN